MSEERKKAARETMHPAEAESIIRGLAAVFETDSGALEAAAGFFQQGARTKMLDEPPDLDARFHTLVEQIPAVIFMAFMGKGIGEAYVSPHIQAVLGFSREEWLHDPVRWYRQIHPEDKERWSLEAARMLVTGEPLRSIYRVMARDGRVVWFQCEAKLVRDENGRPWFIQGIGVDITELKETEGKLETAVKLAERRARDFEAAVGRLKFQIAEREEAEKRLRESEERFRLLVDGIRDYAVFMLNAGGYVLTWNPAAEQIKGYSAGEILGKHFSIFYLRQDIDAGVPEAALQIARSEGKYETEGWRMRKDGSLFWANAILAPLMDDTGAVYGYVKVTRDMTERRLMQDKLQEAERLAAMGTTAAVFAHEIGNPLNGISTSLQFLRRYFARRGESPDSAVSSTLSGVTKEVDRLASLLHDFRSLAKPRKLQLGPTDLAGLVAELTAAERVHYAEKRIEVEQDFPRNLPSIMADPHRLRQALLNLCKNAVEAMPQGGKLSIRGRHFDDSISLDIADTGVGIPDDFPLFELFNTTKESGTGLGLAVVRQIVSAHQGMISYQSEPGKGTTFTIILPLNPQNTE